MSPRMTGTERMESRGESVVAHAPWWRRGLRNGVVLGVLAVGAVLLLNRQDLPGLGRVLHDLPAGLAIAVAVHVPQIWFTGLAWRTLVPGPRPSRTTFALLRWYREAANALLPAGTLVGQAAAARLLARRGVPGEMAGATATVDLTIETVSQLLFTLAGVEVLAATGGALLGAAAGGLALAAAGAVGLVLLQRRLPLGLLERGTRRFGHRLPWLRPEALAQFQAAVLRLHAAPHTLHAALWLHLVAWVLGSLEVMGLLALLGTPISFAEALAVESLAQALRNIGFLLPGAAAVQEGAFVAAGALVGVPPGPALAAALVRRTREVCFGLAGLLAWQREERRAPAVTGGEV